MAMYLTMEQKNRQMLFGNKIRALRDEQGVLQRQLAALLEIDTPMFSKIERGDRRAKRQFGVLSTANCRSVVKYTFETSWETVAKGVASVWKTRVKGRDWYDFEWYVRHRVPLNFKHLWSNDYFLQLADMMVFA